MKTSRIQRGRAALSTQAAPALLLLLLLTAALLTAPALAQGTGVDSADFSLFGNFVLEVDGKVVPSANLYHSPQRKGVLVRSSELSSAVLVIPQGKIIQFYADEEMLDSGTGHVRMIEGARPTSSTTFTLDKAGPRWAMDGKQVRLVANPPLLGLHDRAQVLEHDPAYRYKSETYEPVADYVRTLEEFDGSVKVKVYFGSWCSVCAELMPGILRIDGDLQAAKAPYSFEYYGLPRDYNDPEAQQEGISSVPTAVVWVNGRKIGQINSSSWRYPAMSLRNLVYGVQSELDQRLDAAEVPTPPG